jgi:hypothetical protein
VSYLNIARFKNMEEIVIWMQPQDYSVVLIGTYSDGSYHKVIAGTWMTFKEAQICALGFAKLFHFPSQKITKKLFFF